MTPMHSSMNVSRLPRGRSLHSSCTRFMAAVLELYISSMMSYPCSKPPAQPCTSALSLTCNALVDATGKRLNVKTRPALA